MYLDLFEDTKLNAAVQIFCFKPEATFSDKFVCLSKLSL